MQKPCIVAAKLIMPQSLNTSVQKPIADSNRKQNKTPRVLYMYRGSHPPADQRFDSMGPYLQPHQDVGRAVFVVWSRAKLQPGAVHVEVEQAAGKPHKAQPSYREAQHDPPLVAVVPPVMAVWAMLDDPATAFCSVVADGYGRRNEDAHLERNPAMDTC